MHKQPGKMADIAAEMDIPATKLVKKRAVTAQSLGIKA
jgi:hypothetical protein